MLVGISFSYTFHLREQNSKDNAYLTRYQAYGVHASTLRYLQAPTVLLLSLQAW